MRYIPLRNASTTSPSSSIFASLPSAIVTRPPSRWSPPGPRPLARLVLDLRALSERLEARARDLRMMDEQVLAALFGGDEPVALRVVEPLHSASCHRKNTSLTSYFERVGKCTHNRYSL